MCSGILDTDWTRKLPVDDKVVLEKINEGDRIHELTQWEAVSFFFLFLILMSSSSSHETGLEVITKKKGFPVTFNALSKDYQMNLFHSAFFL